MPRSLKVTSGSRVASERVVGGHALGFKFLELGDEQLELARRIPSRYVDAMYALKYSGAPNSGMSTLSRHLVSRL